MTEKMTEKLIYVTAANFEEEAYLTSNPDIAEAVASGLMPSGQAHFEKHGQFEQRTMRVSLLKSQSIDLSQAFIGTPLSTPKLDLSGQNDAAFLAADVPMASLVSHRNWRSYLYPEGNKPGMKILEIGSREVTAISDARQAFSKADKYVGFDFYSGNNVDVVGDVHRLSSYFEPGEKFDIIYSVACFEHFALPWIVAVEIAKLLKVGGLVFIETHFSYASHERPWHFFQFSDMALKTLFSPALGFECLDAGMSNPMVGRFSSFADEHLRNQPIPGLYCHSEYLGRKVKTVDFDQFAWHNVDLEDIVGNTKYPANSGLQ